ncbi:MAG: hypothetical protein C5B49_10185, partial [Bdellovibrio sp.]
MIEICSITKNFSGRPGLFAGLSLQIRQGEFVCLLGPSGCGKSTLLRMVSGIELPDRGEVQVSQPSLGVVFQDPRLLRWRTVEENICLPLELGSIAKETGRNISSLLRLVRLDSSVAKLFPHQLSGGMKMR